MRTTEIENEEVNDEKIVASEGFDNKEKTTSQGMKQTREKLKKLLPCLIFLAVTVVILVLFLALRTNCKICEFVTKNIAGKINAFMSDIASKLPFSAFEFFIVFSICVVGLILVAIIVLAVKRKGMVILKIITSVVGIVFLFGSYYVLVAGFAYNRAEIEQFCPDYNMGYWEYYEMAKWYQKDYIALGENIEREENGLSVCPYTLDELNEKLKAEVQRLGDYFNVDACFSVKPMKLFSEYMSDTRIAGVTFLPTGDCGVNCIMPSVEFTSTAMHEMMHSVGVMRENEANFMACYLLISSEDDYLRYCGYIEFYGYLYQGLAINATSEELYSVGVSQAIYKESSVIREFWNSRKPLMDKIGDFFNDLYLKLSGQKQGTDSYHEPTKPGNDKYEEGDRVFYDVAYNNFQQAFMRNYLDKVKTTEE